MAPTKIAKTSTTTTSTTSTSSEKNTNDALAEERIQTLLKELFGLGEGGRHIVMRWVRTMATGDVGLARVCAWFLHLINGRVRAPPAERWQAGCPDIIPGLMARPFWRKSLRENDVSTSWLYELEAATDAIRHELFTNAEGCEMFQPYRAPLWANPNRPAPDGLGSEAHDAGTWNVSYLLLHNVDFKKNRDRFPVTMQALRRVPRLYDHAFISALAPGTHIAKHHGPTNKKLRVHIPLIVPSANNISHTAASRLRVGNQVEEFKRGHVIVFDDSFEHEAWNDSSDEWRVCLIFDIWHPDLSDREVTLLKFLEKAKMNRAKKMSEAYVRNQSENDRHKEGTSGEENGSNDGNELLKHDVEQEFKNGNKGVEGGPESFYELLETVGERLKTSVPLVA